MAGSPQTAQNHPKKMVRKAGFEPATYHLGGDRSIQLSYKRMGGK